LALPLTKFIVPRSDAILVPGSKHKEYFISLGASPDRVFIMPYASNIAISEKDYESKKEIREKLNIVNRKVILYTGRLIKLKGVEYLIEAFAKLKKERDDIVLIIVGEGGSWGELELLSKNLGIEDSVCFTGFVDNSDLAAYYLLCDVCVVPSITHGRSDIWVHVVNDAMEAGKPVVATDAVGAAFDMVKDGINGFMVPEKDSEALYKAIKKIISEPALAKRMGEASKRIVEEGFKYEHMVDGFIEAVNYVSQEIMK
jgi:glycosyltransferase involved in cell wall biosynthesis